MRVSDAKDDALSYVCGMGLSGFIHSRRVNVLCGLIDRVFTLKGADIVGLERVKGSDVRKKKCCLCKINTRGR
ncbi:hypothetical protein H5P28_10875 [Ruficoccus amylovorans]|uniref:Uncharacterized protein n=1 Tax=Ruficoccus amylovorans TaxID=1804625 RepID=A0A842HGT1_9BACT|nr:hypothetical protein [Ruficoccus amylovorans]MBC2594764.1 hypothetical protein [Ruficoccus amylovorans]